MKKILSLLLTLALLSGLSVIAFASEDPADGGATGGDQTRSTGGNQAVTARITGAPSWVLVIPADQTITFMAEETDIVQANCMIENPKHIPADCTINASLTHTGNFTMSTDENKKIPFTLNAFDDDVAVGTPVIVSQYWSDTRNNHCYSGINIVISRDSWKNAQAGGTYTTPVSYTSVLVDEITAPADGGSNRD